MANVIVLGGGAAGLAAAIAAASCGDRVTVLERMDRVGKKLLATGNGRCNLMNTGSLRYPGGAPLAEAVLARCGVKEQTAFWRELGLCLREEESGRVYPASGQASTVLDALRFGLERLGVEVRTEANVTALERTGKRWTLRTEHMEYVCDRVILAAGGKAQPKLGSNGSAYAMLTAQGHTLTPLFPALTQIETDTAPIRGLSGIRIRCGIAVERNGKLLHREQGELLFADYGVSGVCTMQCARWARKGDRLHLDLLKGLGLDRETTGTELLRRRENWQWEPAERLLSGWLVPRLAGCVLAAAGVETRNRGIGQLTDRELCRVTDLLQDLPLTVKGVKGFETAQVTAGGIAWQEFEPETLASRLVPGLHACGELLDVDGDCGGFNLMFAFGSGILAGKNGRKAPWEEEHDHS